MPVQEFSSNCSIQFGSCLRLRSLSAVRCHFSGIGASHGGNKFPRSPKKNAARKSFDEYLTAGPFFF